MKIFCFSMQRKIYIIFSYYAKALAPHPSSCKSLGTEWRLKNNLGKMWMWLCFIAFKVLPPTILSQPQYFPNHPIVHSCSVRQSAILWRGWLTYLQTIIHWESMNFENLNVKYMWRKSGLFIFTFVNKNIFRFPWNSIFKK